MRAALVFLLLALTLKSSAQVNFTFSTIFENTFNKPVEKNKFGRYKAQKIKGKISGMGVFLFNNGSLYYGDLYEKEFHGKGTLISTDSISNCPESSIYVGKFKSGKKSGFGRCYNTHGELVYEGVFKNDKPTDIYPSVSCQRDALPYFSEISTDNYTFLGEFVGEYPSGPGMFVFSDGSLYLTELIDGSPDGISVLIEADNTWISEKIVNGVSIPISSSTQYTSLKKQAKANFWAALSDAAGYFSQAVQMGSQMAEQVKSISAVDINQLDDSTAADDSYSYNSRSNNSNSKDKYNLSEQRAYNSDKSTYHKYDGMLSKVFSGNSSASASEIKEWQSKMKQLREKWEKKGRDFPHFSNEDR